MTSITACGSDDLDNNGDGATEEVDSGMPDLGMRPDDGLTQEDMPDPVDDGPDVDMPDPTEEDMRMPPADDGGSVEDMPEDMPPVDMAPVRLRVDALTPPRGPLDGGTPFAIEGAGFTSATAVFFGSDRADVEVVDGNLVGTTPPGQAPGPVNVKVLDPDRGDDTLTGGFTYTAPLILDSIAPSRIPTTGGVLVDVRGDGFDGETRVSFGGETASAHTLVDPTLMRVLAPPHVAGTFDVRVTNVDDSVQLIDGITYFEKVRVDAVRPASGSLAGGEVVTVEGAGFDGSTTFEFDGRAATVQSVTPAGDAADVLTPSATSAGLVDVRVANASGDAAIGLDLFYYSDAAALDLVKVTPASGPAAGGNEVTLIGTNLGGANVQVDFGGVAATQVVDQGTGYITVRVPAGMVGVVDVTVTDGNDTSSLSGAYTYVADLWIDRITPNTGDVAGGYQVVLEGEGYTGVTRVSFGGVQAPQFTVDSDTQITATAPAHTAGIVDVTVERGDASATFRDGFTFTEALEVFSFTPTRGSVAGNTYVEVRGRGFVGSMGVTFGGAAGTNVRVLDGQTLSVRTPQAQMTGSVDVVVTNGAGDSVTAAERYLYFNPGARSGGAWGGSIQGAVNVSVFSAGGGPIENAFVMLSTRRDTVYQGFTDPAGMLTLSGPDVRGEQTITALAAGHSSATVQRIDAENITIFLQPDPNPMPPPPGPMPATFKGEITGLDKIGIPTATEFRMAIVYTTQSDTATPNPAPGNGNVVLENGPYTITSRLGDLSLVALGGLYDNATQTFRPMRMGVSRYQRADEGVTYNNVDIDLNIPLDQTLPVKLNNAPTGATTGNQIQTWLDFGFEGVFGQLPIIRGSTNLLVADKLPRLQGQMSGVTVFVEGGAYTNGNAPFSIGFGRDLTQADLNQVLDLDLLGIAQVLTPSTGQRPTDGLVSFNYTSSNKPDLFYVRIQTPMRLVRWEAFLPGTATSFKIPDFPDFSNLPPDQRPAPYKGEPLTMIIYAIDQPGLTFTNFTYGDLNPGAWTAYSATAYPIQL